MNLRNLDRRAFLAGVVTALTGVAAESGKATTLNPYLAGPSLWRLAAKSGRYFGCATSTGHLAADSAFVSLVLNQCSYITPEYQLKWDAIEYAPGAFNYGPIDELLTFAQRNGKELRGHTLLWEQSTPNWVRQQILSSGNWSIISDYFEQIFRRYGSYIKQWDVVNEPIDTQTGVGGLRTNTFFRAYGPHYIERALREARLHAPQARLMINDFSFEYANPVDEARRETFVALLRSLKASDTPLDGVGIQAHLDLSKGPLPIAKLRDFFRRIGELGLFIIITELDVKEVDTRESLGVRDAKVALETARYLAVALAEPAVRGVVTWGLSDKYSWLSAPGTPETLLNRGLPYDARFVRKPMYSAIKSAFTSIIGR